MSSNGQSSFKGFVDSPLTTDKNYDKQDKHPFNDDKNNNSLNNDDNSKAFMSATSKKDDRSKSTRSSVRLREFQMEAKALEQMTKLDIEATLEATEKVKMLKRELIQKKLKLEKKMLKSESASSCSKVSVIESVATEVKNERTQEWLLKQRKMNQNGNERKFKLEYPKRDIHFEQNRSSSYREDKDENDLCKQPMTNNFLARQSFNKELPFFSGDPLEWPMFVSFYGESNKACRYSNAENMCRLQKCLKGVARESVQMLLLQPENVNKVIDTLEFRFGRAELIISQLIDKAKQLKPPRDDKFDSVMSFAIAVQNLSAMLVNFKSMPHLMNPQLLNELVGKLPCALQLRWGELLYNNRDKYATVENFSNWLMDIARASSMVVSQSPFVPVTSKVNFVRKQVEPQNMVKYPLYTVVESKEKPVKNVVKLMKICEYCDDKNHKIDGCEKFKILTIDERWNFVMKKGMCWACLKRYHRYKNCTMKQECGINYCKLTHHALLHRDQLVSVQNTEIEIQTSCHTVDEKEKILFKILPVKLYGPNGVVSTYAFLDDGSSVTLMEDKIAKELGYDGERSPLCLKWTGSTFKTEEKSQKIDVAISGDDQKDKVYEMTNVRTVDCLNLPCQSLNLNEMVCKYPHLEGVHVKDLNNAVPGLLIGINQTKLGIYDDVKEAENVDIVAVKTKIGWTIYGKGALQTSDPTVESFSFHVCERKPNDVSLHHVNKKYFSTDDFGMKVPEKPLKSLKNLHAVLILDTKVKEVVKKDSNVDLHQDFWNYGTVKYNSLVDCDCYPDVHVMTEMIFGSASSHSSLCCAQEIKNRNAIELIEEFPVVVEDILNNHEVDDCLDRFEEEEELQVLEDGAVQRLRLSNAIEKDLNVGVDDEHKPAKPIGFLAQLFVCMMVLIQGIWMAGNRCNDVNERWRVWFKELPRIKDQFIGHRIRENFDISGWRWVLTMLNLAYCKKLFKALVFVIMWCSGPNLLRLMKREFNRFSSFVELYQYLDDKCSTDRIDAAQAVKEAGSDGEFCDDEPRILEESLVEYLRDPWKKYLIGMAPRTQLIVKHFDLREGVSRPW